MKQLPPVSLEIEDPKGGSLSTMSQNPPTPTASNGVGASRIVPPSKIDQREKAIERNFTEQGMRKDVVYKCMLRYFKRTLEGNFRKLYDYTKNVRKPKSTRNRLMKIKTELHLPSLLKNAPPTEDILYTLIAIIDTKRKFVEPSSHKEQFRRLLSGLLYQMNIGKLYDLTKDQDFALLFNDFWSESQHFSNFVQFMMTKTQMNEVRVYC